MHRNAMRWLGQPKGPSWGIKSFLCHEHDRVLSRRICISPKHVRRPLQVLPLSRALCSSSRLQVKGPSFFSQSTYSSPGQHSTFAQTRISHIRGPQWILLALVFTASAATAYLYRRRSASHDDDVINTATFSAFTIIRREQVSPSAFIITLRPSAWVNAQEVESGDVEQSDGPTGFLSNRIQKAWRHGLWSIEIKQPQLQIARHYTPLPPLPTPAGSSSIKDESTFEDGNTDEMQADLRILIRRMDGGEMSNYLSRQCVGDTVWLRGPHLGFDVPRRLGTANNYDSGIVNGDVRARRGVVFLAGGTGIAPALQIAHKLLDGNDYSDREKNRPRISILWANRWGADTLGRELPPSIQKKSVSWLRFWGSKGADPRTDLQEKQKQSGEEAASSLALQIQDFKRRHPAHFEISYFVDNEGLFIEECHVKAALASTTPSTGSGARGPSSSFSSSLSIDKSCTWHSSKAVELLPDDNDAARSSSSDSSCVCTKAGGVQSTEASPGVNLVCVSGPDGFIEAYAGTKRWHNGNEMQGAIRGLLGRIRNDGENNTGEWLVLKL